MSEEISHCKYCLDKGNIFDVEWPGRQGTIRLCDPHQQRFIADLRQKISNEFITLSRHETIPEEMGPNNT